MRQGWRWLLSVNPFARRARRKIWHSLSCYDIKFSPAHGDARVYLTFVNPLAASALHPHVHGHRNGCGSEKRLALNIIDSPLIRPPYLTPYNLTPLFSGFAFLFLLYIPSSAYNADLVSTAKTNKCTLHIFQFLRTLLYSSLGLCDAFIKYMWIDTIVLFKEKQKCDNI